MAHRLDPIENVPTGNISAVTDQSLSWFAVYTTPRHEKRAAQHLELRGMEYFLPLYSTPRRWKDGSRVTLDLPVFPSYIFVRTTRRERVRVLEIPSVLWMVGPKREPTPMPDLCIESLREAVRLRKIEPHPDLVVGERVRIKNGVMAGMEGILVRKKKDLRVVLTLDLTQQSFAMEVDADNLEPISTFTRMA
ncbi:MAG: UpxY family transcription antiterminator [Candidatus Korobacteraceae bacterium]